MKSIGSALLDAIKHLNIVRNLPKNFNEEEQRLVVQSVIIGVVVWAIVTSLKTAVHWLFETVLHVVESGPSPWLLFIPLLLGALAVAWLARIVEELDLIQIIRLLHGSQQWPLEE